MAIADRRVAGLVAADAHRRAAQRRLGQHRDERLVRLGGVGLEREGGVEHVAGHVVARLLAAGVVAQDRRGDRRDGELLEARVAAGPRLATEFGDERIDGVGVSRVIGHDPVDRLGGARRRRRLERLVHARITVYSIEAAVRSSTTSLTDASGRAVVVGATPTRPTPESEPPQAATTAAVATDRPPRRNTWRRSIARSRSRSAAVAGDCWFTGITLPPARAPWSRWRGTESHGDTTEVGEHDGVTRLRPRRPTRSAWPRRCPAAGRGARCAWSRGCSRVPAPRRGTRPRDR